MPQQRDLNRTRERILAAAQKEFAASGLAGSRTDAIARRARVNERMIFYCFDSKEGLYRAVLTEKLSARARMIELHERTRRMVTTAASVEWTVVPHTYSRPSP